jgi:ornithine carbamoyltransferase
MKRDFLKLADRTPEDYFRLFARARALKARRREGKGERTLEGRTLVLLFEKPSTRTRVSFEAAMLQLGGGAVALPLSESQVPRGEPLKDTIRVLASYSDGIVLRTFGDERLLEAARHSRVPVINGLSDGGHPVQVLADLFTIEERLGSVSGRRVAFVGDGASNMARSFVEASRLFGFDLCLAAPEGFRPPAVELERAEGRVQVVDRPELAVRDAEVVVTDVWTSMGQEAEAARRRAAFEGFCVDERLVSCAAPSCIVLHCLPAHRGEEIAEEVLEGPRSAVFDEAENRLHVQKALLEETLL